MVASKEQREDFQFFLDNYNEYYKKYGHSFIAIKDKKVVGVYHSYSEGVEETKKSEPMGTFIVQEVNGDESAYTVRIPLIFATGRSE